jgi:MoaA/NifB/PqqE/SkfB family radical SAM enzyme
VPYQPNGPETAVPRYPEQITLEITTRCNLDCVMCPHGLPNGMPIKKDASDALIDSLLAMLDHIKFVHPIGTGEPMLAPGFWRLVDALTGRSMPRLIMNTNGVLLTAQNVARLVKAPVGHVSVSMDAAHPETYRKIRGFDLRKVTDGARRLAAAFAAAEDPDEHLLFISMVMMRENIEELPDFVRLAKDIGANGIYVEHLSPSALPLEQWIVRRDDFEFRYSSQQLKNYPYLSDKCVVEALDLSDSLGMKMHGPDLLFNQDRVPTEDRPCRQFDSPIIGAATADVTFRQRLQMALERASGS